MTTEADSLLDEQICFALYNASRAVTARYRDLLAPIGITYPQYLVLLVLWETGTATVSALGARLHLDSGTLSPLLRRLESTGLVTRTRVPGDDRSVEIGLTEAGTALRERAAELPGLVCAATGLDLDDIRVLRDQVSSLAAHVRATNSTLAGPTLPSLPTDERRTSRPLSDKK